MVTAAHAAGGDGMSADVLIGGAAEPDAATVTVDRAATVGFRVSHQIALLDAPESPQSEAIRSLRAHLLATHLREGRRSLAISGATVGVGTSYVAVNLAVALAQAGLNTLLIDADLNESGVEQYIRPDERISGLRQMLESGDGDVTDHVQNDIMPNLSVLFSGGPGPKSSELIANKRFKSVLDGCFRDYEMTIIDTSAVGGTADARRAAMHARYALMVARRHVSQVSGIRTLVDEMTGDHVRLIGTFLTDF